MFLRTNAKWMAVVSLALGLWACGEEESKSVTNGPCAVDCASSGKICNEDTLKCVDCLESPDCKDESLVCQNNICLPKVECDENNPCPNGGKCGPDFICMSSQEVDCVTPANMPANAEAIVAKVTVNWTREDGWSEADVCQWKCKDGFTLDGSKCLSNASLGICESDDECTNKGCVEGKCLTSKTVPCDETLGPKPEGGESLLTNPTVSVSWNVSGHGWNKAPACVWECAEGLVLKDSTCQAPVCGDGIVEGLEACDTGANLDLAVAVYPSGKGTCAGAMSKKAREWVGEVSCKADCSAIITDDCREKICTPGKACKVVDGVTQVCTEDGTGYSADISCGEDMACNENGICEISCEPGTCRYQADGTTLEICGSKGTIWQTNKTCPEATQCTIAEGEKLGVCACDGSVCDGDEICVNGGFASCPDKVEGPEDAPVISKQVCRMVGSGASVTVLGVPTCVDPLYCEVDAVCAKRTDKKTMCNTEANLCVECLTDDDCGKGFGCSEEKVCVDLCGNGVLDASAGEVCEGDDLGGATCASMGFASGTLSCTEGCGFSFDQCVRHEEENIIISQFYPVGGSSGASWDKDYVELFNKSAHAINLHNWGLAYASATGKSWNVTVLSGVIPANGFFLLASSGDNKGGEALTYDLTFKSAMGGKGGKLLLAKPNGNKAITQSDVGGNCPDSDKIVDFISYGNGDTCSDIVAGKAPTASGGLNAVMRKNLGCMDTDRNDEDFEVVTAMPRTSATSPVICDANTCFFQGCMGSSWCAAIDEAVEIQQCGEMTPRCHEDRGCVECLTDNDCGNGGYCTDENTCSDVVCAKACTTMTEGEGDETVSIEGICTDFGPGLAGTWTACGESAPHCIVTQGVGSCVACVKNEECGDGLVCANNVCAEPPPVPRVIISQYVEGSYTNRAVELYNFESSPMACTLKNYANGKTSAEGAIDVTIPAQSTIVVMSNQSNDAMKELCTTLGSGKCMLSTSSAVNFSGDDALEIKCGDLVTDIFGRKGEQPTQPGKFWSATVGDQTLKTADMTLSRKCTVTEGVTENPASGFPTLATEWEGAAMDNLDGLGEFSPCNESSVDGGEGDLNEED